MRRILFLITAASLLCACAAQSPESAASLPASSAAVSASVSDPAAAVPVREQQAFSFSKKTEFSSSLYAEAFYGDAVFCTAPSADGYYGIERRFLSASGEASPVLSFPYSYMQPESLAVSADKILYAPVESIKDNVCTLNITLLDFTNETVTVLAQPNASSGFVQWIPINENSFAYYYEGSDGAYHIDCCDIAAGSCSLLYSTAEEKLLAVCRQDNSFRLLLQNGDAVHTQLISSSGEVLSDVSLPQLARYAEAGFSVDAMVSTPEALLLHYAYSAELPLFVVIDLAHGQQLSTADPYPCQPLVSTPVQGRYFVFSMHPDHMDYESREFSYDIAVFDLHTLQWHKLPLLPQPVKTVLCNSSGQLLFLAADSSAWYTASLTQLL